MGRPKRCSLCVMHMCCCVGSTAESESAPPCKALAWPLLSLRVVYRSLDRPIPARPAPRAPHTARCSSACSVMPSGRIRQLRNTVGLRVWRDGVTSWCRGYSARHLVAALSLSARSSLPSTDYYCTTNAMMHTIDLTGYQTPH